MNDINYKDQDNLIVRFIYHRFMCVLFSIIHALFEAANLLLFLCFWTGTVVSITRLFGIDLIVAAFPTITIPTTVMIVFTAGVFIVSHFVSGKIEDKALLVTIPHRSISIDIIEAIEEKYIKIRFKYKYDYVKTIRAANFFVRQISKVIYGILFLLNIVVLAVLYVLGNIGLLAMGVSAIYILITVFNGSFHWVYLMIYPAVSVIVSPVMSIGLEIIVEEFELALDTFGEFKTKTVNKIPYSKLTKSEKEAINYVG